MTRTGKTATIQMRGPLLRGDSRVRVALVGMPGCGKSTLFRAVQSTSARGGALAGTHSTWRACEVDVGLDQAQVVDLPSVRWLRDPGPEEQPALKYLLWGNRRPAVSAHETDGPPAPFAPPDVIVQVIDACALERNLELTLELLSIGRPLVIALNKMDEARERGMHIATKVLAKRLGVPVIATAATMGYGIAPLFAAAVEAARRGVCPLPLTPGAHLLPHLEPLAQGLRRREISRAFRVPLPFLVTRIAERDPYFSAELAQHFPQHAAEVLALRADGDEALPRPLCEELHADRHHVAAILAETAVRPGGVREQRDWRYWLDELFLRPGWGLLGSAIVFAAVLFVVFDISAWLDSMTSARLAQELSTWQPDTAGGVVLRAVADGVVGLIGIVVPYMIPLVLLLIVLEQAGIMARIAFAIDRGFHKLGLHGGIAVPFLLGLGCNVPALTAIRDTTKGGERFVASVLVTFVPCSARSAIVLALAGKYLGVPGALAVFAAPIVVIAVLGHLIRRRTAATPGHIQEIPPYAWPNWRSLLRETWLRTRDVLTIVTPLLVGGSVVLALLHHIDADRLINLLLSPLTHWWLGLPVVLGVPLLFGVLRKELSLAMIFQALGGMEVDRYMDAGQILTFLLFVTLYVPCVSTLAVMMGTIGRKRAFYAAGVTIGVAVAVGGLARFALVAWGAIAS